MKRNWFYRMLFSYMPVFLAVCCTLLFIMFLTVRQLSEQSSIQSNETVANNAVQMLEQTLVGIEESMAGLINSETIIGYYSRPDDTLYTSSYQAALALTSLQKRFPIIHDLYLVNPEDSSVLEATKITELIRHPDQAYIEAKLKSKTRYLWGDRRAPSASSSLGEAEVISLARIADLRTRGLLVVRIDVKAMQQLLNRSVNPATGYIQVLDRSGSLVVSTQSTEEGGKESRKLAQVNMAYTGWTIESGVLQPGILSWAEPVLYISISLGGFCILVGLAWIVMTTRRHYRPVQSLISQISMVDTLRKPASSVHEGSKDEFQTIGNAIDNLWNHSNQLRQENEANLKLKREHQFRRMAEGR
ncbi:MAG: hypothetical protein K0R67_2507, partial [Paenibacillus sp.]|nr:hypothetical protein [Paenibacillus sp.]